MFLRWATFSQIRARERIQAYLKVKNISPVMWRNIDTREKRLEEIIHMGFVIRKFRYKSIIYNNNNKIIADA